MSLITESAVEVKKKKKQLLEVAWMTDCSPNVHDPPSIIILGKCLPLHIRVGPYE